MDPVRKRALVTGVLFLITIVTSIPALVLYGPVLSDASYIVGGGADGRVFAGAFLEVLLAIANIGTAVTLFPVIKRQSESLALGYVAARIVESTVIVVGIASVLAVVTLRRDLAAGAGADAATLVVAGKALVAIHQGTFLLGPAFCAGIENGLILGYLMYRSRLVPRPMAVLGLAGGALACCAATAELFGLFPQVSGPSFILTFPEALWEASLGIWLVAKGFRSSPVTAAVSRRAAADGDHVAPGPAAA
jgi:uncharacterized membrane protein YfbV (UPF0208 family)